VLSVLAGAGCPPVHAPTPATVVAAFLALQRGVPEPDEARQVAFGRLPEGPCESLGPLFEDVRDLAGGHR